MSDGSEHEEFLQHLEDLFLKVETDALERHRAGAETYGALKFLGADTLQELYEEVLDLINYGRYTAVKVLLLRAALAEQAAPASTSPTTGGFVSTSELMGKGFREE